LIDAKLFEGSSGSLVISKPKNMYISDEDVIYYKQKKFDFLGIFSGEPHLKNKNGDPIYVNVGKVWRWDTIKGLL